MNDVIIPYASCIEKNIVYANTTSFSERVKPQCGDRERRNTLCEISIETDNIDGYIIKRKKRST